MKGRRIKENPAETLHFIKHTASRQPLSLTQKEVHALLRVAGQSPHKLAKRNLAILHLFLQAGLRIGEVTQLQIRDITIYTRSGTVKVVYGKGRKQRDVPLNTTVRSALSAYLATYEKQEPDHFLFISKRGTAVAIRTVQQMIFTLAKKAQLTRINVSAHTLRHTFATHYLEANPSKLTALATLLGHESCNTTAVYTKISDEKLASTVEQLDINIYGEQ